MSDANNTHVMSSSAAKEALREAIRQVDKLITWAPIKMNQRCRLTAVCNLLEAEILDYDRNVPEGENK